MLSVSPGLGQASQRPREEDGIHQERDELARRHLAVRNIRRTKPDHQHDSTAGYHVDQRADERLQI